MGGVSGGFAALGQHIANIAKLRQGRLIGDITEAAGSTAVRLTLASWDRRASPDGRAWVGSAASSLAGRLRRTGRLRDSVRVERRPGGLIILSRAVADGGAYYSGTHQYGRTIRAKGPRGMRWKAPGGVWVGASKIRVPARPFLPRSGTLPLEWANELRRAAGEAFDKVMK